MFVEKLYDLATRNDKFNKKTISVHFQLFCVPASLNFLFPLFFCGGFFGFICSGYCCEEDCIANFSIQFLNLFLDKLFFLISFLWRSLFPECYCCTSMKLNDCITDKRIFVVTMKRFSSNMCNAMLLDIQC